MTVAIGSTRVLEEVSLRVWPGEVVGLVGPNGAGKSTLLRVLATLLAPGGGHARVLGTELSSAARNGARGRIALLGHDPALHPSLSLRENLQLVADLAGMPPSRGEMVLEAVGLGGAADRRVERCSRGMIRRAEIARALLTRPQLLLLDEAHAGLD
ncbi:MAG: ATP-binding cassette domain-containing protein, partial [Actinomycetota bacterium]|nr:ATP-binding cassette domain-containing protein [Actinomycetota bacterium]